MIRKFKTLGLAMIAVLAMSAFVASTAQAQYTASSYPTSVGMYTALGNDVFTTEGGTVECQGTYGGHLNEASNSLTISPYYENCKAFGFVSATVTMNGCAYIFDRQSATSSTATVECATGNKIQVIAGNCEVTIGAQSPTGSVATSNGAGFVNVQANVTGIAYTVVKDGFLCPFGGTGSKTGGTYKQVNAASLMATTPGRTISVD
ncbi:MAG TPA: hypothetical protein VLI94_13940 [Solirubrobacterales bacterium]|nr:hypothetical protein [Solirubrobacterales bacterium]